MIFQIIHAHRKKSYFPLLKKSKYKSEKEMQQWVNRGYLGGTRGALHFSSSV